MVTRNLALGTVAWLLMAVAGASAADNASFQRLGGSTEATTMTLGFNGEADTTLASWRFRGYRHGFYYYRPYSFRFAFYNPGFYSYPYYYAYPYRSFGLGYRSFSLGFGISPYYYGPVGYYTPAYSYYPISYSVPTASYSAPINPPAASYSAPINPPAQEITPQRERVPLPRSGGGTFPYDGGPTNPVPLPRTEPGPIQVPGKTLPAQNRVVSIPVGKSRFAYLAYGEKVQTPISENLLNFRVNLQAAR